MYGADVVSDRLKDRLPSEHHDAGSWKDYDLQIWWLRCEFSHLGATHIIWRAIKEAKDAGMEELDLGVLSRKTRSDYVEGAGRQ